MNNQYECINKILMGNKNIKNILIYQNDDMKIDKNFSDHIGQSYFSENFSEFKKIGDLYVFLTKIKKDELLIIKIYENLNQNFLKILLLLIEKRQINIHINKNNEEKIVVVDLAEFSIIIIKNKKELYDQNFEELMDVIIQFNNFLSKKKEIMFNKVTYINFSQVQISPEIFIAGVGSSPLYVFENTNSGETIALYGDNFKAATQFKSMLGFSEICWEFIEKFGIKEYHEISKKSVDIAYLNELIYGLYNDDISDFNYENKQKSQIIYQENIKNLKNYANKFGILILQTDQFEFLYYKDERIFKVNEEIFASGGQLFSFLDGNSNERAVFVE